MIIGEKRPETISPDRVTPSIRATTSYRRSYRRAGPGGGLPGRSAAGGKAVFCAVFGSQWILILLLAVLSAAPAQGQIGPGPGGDQASLVGPRLDRPTGRSKAAGLDHPALLKVSSHLRAARRQLLEGEPVASVRRALPGLTWVEDQVEVEVRLERLTPSLLAQLRSAGLEVRFASDRHARLVGRVDPARLDEIAAFEAVATIHPLYGFTTWAGSVDNQADASIRTDLARSTFGVDGTGIEVGVLSDSFNSVIGGTVSGTGCARTLTGSSSQGSGDLPPSVRLLDNGAGGTDEGAGMAELIYDLVPGADLAFHTAGASETEFASGIDDLRTCGADVIVDDVIFFAEPMFQDGPVAQAAQAAFDAGLPYFSSAGNTATFGVDETFQDSQSADGVSLGDDFHDFGGGDRFAEIVVPGGGCGVRLVLQWNDPFDGTLGPGAADDLDLYLCTSTNPADCIFSSTSAQGCSLGSGVQAGDPLEILSVVNNGGAAAPIYAAVDEFCGGEDAHFRIAVFGIGCSVTGYGFEAGIYDRAQIYGHAAAEGAEAVAAIFYGEIDSGGSLDSPAGQIDVEPFSSLGGDLPFYFDGSGDPLAGAPVTRFKPEIAAPDGTNTTFFGADIGFDADSDPNFFGTSAAAPHAAALAALLLDASPDLAPNGVRQVLRASARDAETPGVDPLSGYGLVDALDAVQTVSTTGSGCVPVLDLEEQEIVGTQFFRACDTINAGPSFVVQGAADLTFRAGQRIVLESGFSVESGASFVAEIDPSL